MIREVRFQGDIRYIEIDIEMSDFKLEKETDIEMFGFYKKYYIVIKKVENDSNRKER